MASTRHSEPLSGSSDQVIPARIMIGVTGHRQLENISELTDSVRLAIEKVRQMLPPLQSTPPLLTILSPLAEGADRLVVREVLSLPKATLEAILPVEQSEYMQDFETAESRVEFEELISRASSVKTIPVKGQRAKAYEQAGRYLVDQCDVLIALWDGEQAAGRGGTQEIVQYARDTKCPLIWTDTKKPEQITLELGRGLNIKSLQNLVVYNSEVLNAVRFEKQLRKLVKFFQDATERAKLPFDRFQSTIEYFLHHYVRADILSLRYQHLHYRAETLVYMLASGAVVVAAFQTIFMPQRRLILILELVLMLAILAIVGLNRRRLWHKKWIDYRFLAERFRSALFMALANMEIQTLRPPKYFKLAYSPKDWMVAAFFSVWSQRPRLEKDDSSMFEKLRTFVSEAWIQDQIQYHDSTQKRHYKRYFRMTVASYTLFALTICITVLLIINIVRLEPTLALAATILPAIAACIAAIRTQRDYLRNSMRSAEMLEHLEEIKSRISAAQDTISLCNLLKETEETMLHENEDWRVVVRFHKPEVPV